MTEGEKQILPFDRPFAKLRAYSGQARCSGQALRSDSPRPLTEFGTGAQPRPQAPWGGAMGWRGVRLLKTKAKKRRWIPDLVGNDRLGKKRE